MILLRYLTEAIIITALHVTSPSSLGEGFFNTLGISLGIALMYITGRDVSICCRFYQSKYHKAAVILIGLLISCHAVIFMIFPTIYDIESLTDKISLEFSLSIGLQVAVLGISNSFSISKPNRYAVVSSAKLI